MRSRPLVVFWLVGIWCLLSARSTVAAQPPDGSKNPKVVIPFDFESAFDKGRYGKMVGEMIWKKLERRGGFVIPESALDTRQWTERTGMVPNPDTPLAKMKSIMRDDFAADVAIWGKVERLPGFDWDVYDFWINIVDFSVNPPREIARIKARTKTVSEIPHKYVKQALDRLYGVDGTPLAATKDEEAEKRWRDGANLVRGDFETAKGWDRPEKYISREVERSENGKQNHFIRFTIPKAVAASSGVLYYSDFFPVQEGATYRFQCRWRSSGCQVKVFIKCYDEMDTRFSKTGNASGTTQRREVYRSQQNLKGPANVWNTQTEDFTPRHTQYKPKWGRVMLYGYWPAGTVDWDDVVVKQIVPPSKYVDAKERRPSLETKVRSEELERLKKNGHSERTRRPRK